MSKYDFIKAGNLLYWNDPDNGISSGDYKVISVPEEVHEDSIILIASRHSEAEVFASELSPIPQTRSHKEEFLKWREKQEADGSVFYNRLSDVIATEFDLEVGDMVAFTNDYGVSLDLVRYWLSASHGTVTDVCTLTVMPIGLQTVRAN